MFALPTRQVFAARASAVTVATLVGRLRFATVPGVKSGLTHGQDFAYALVMLSEFSGTPSEACG